MRTIDWSTSIQARDAWAGKPANEPPLCPLIADLDRLLDHLEAIRLEPGDAIGCCPSCGQEYRWVLIKELLIHAMKFRPDHPSGLMKKVDSSLDEVRALYGGKEKYEAMERDAEAFFARVNVDHKYIIR